MHTTAEFDNQVVRLESSRWATEVDFHRDVKDALDFPDYYESNLDALNDCLRYVVGYDYGWLVP